MKILIFDAESNGLHGEAFAIGGVSWDLSTNTMSDFEGQAPPPEPIDAWVAENVLPFIGNMTMYETRRALRDAFWAWLQANKAGAIIIADFGVPVEANLLAACQRDDPTRAWDGPYPLHELGTMLLAADVDPDVNRIEYAKTEMYSEWNTVRQHNPYDDALVAAHCWARAWRSVLARHA